MGDLGSIPGLGRSSGGENGNPLLYSCLENPFGQRSLEGYSSWGHKELDTTKQLNNNKKRTTGFPFEFKIVTIIQIKFLIIVKYLGNPSTGK